MLSSRVKELKLTEGDAEAVCEVMERYQAEAVKKGKKGNWNQNNRRELSRV